MSVTESNHLFPVFLKLENRRVLIIGGGNVALEKLNALIQNVQGASIRLIAEKISDEIKAIAKDNSNIELIEKSYNVNDLDHADFIFSAVNNLLISREISKDAQAKGKLINVADKPELCDFYLSSIVKKGNLKIAISTNGKSPTIAKRLKEVFNDVLPDELDDLLNNMHIIRNKLKGDFTSKVSKLNSLTKLLAAGKGL